jgi:NAD-dependent dihydropyrimidine dehydrogenase PreA subunit
MFIWGALLWRPELGLHLLWNVLNPVAPANLVVAPGVWRNVCPLGSMSLAPHHFGLSQRKRLSPQWRGRLYLGAFVLLIVVVPLRKVLLDTNGPVLAAILAAVGLLAIGLGFVFNWKSGWCSSLCPVYPVELLYGSQPLVSVHNAHCPHCTSCVAPCSESTVALTPRTAINTKLGRSVGIVLTGCFPGFVWGWYNVPTYSGWEGIRHLHMVYAMPYTMGGLTLALYLALRTVWCKQEDLIASVFAASAIMTYYWFRLPPMFGIGDPDAAMIVDISGWLPSWSATALRMFELFTFSWLMVGRTEKRRAWEMPLPTAE